VPFVNFFLLKECAEGEMLHSSLLFGIKIIFLNSSRFRPTLSYKIISVAKSSLEFQALNLAELNPPLHIMNTNKTLSILKKVTLSLRKFSCTFNCIPKPEKHTIGTTASWSHQMKMHTQFYFFQFFK
jgi:peptidase E